MNFNLSKTIQGGVRSPGKLSAWKRFAIGTSTALATLSICVGAVSLSGDVFRIVLLVVLMCFGGGGAVLPAILVLTTQAGYVRYVFFLLTFAISFIQYGAFRKNKTLLVLFWGLLALLPWELVILYRNCALFGVFDFRTPILLYSYLSFYGVFLGYAWGRSLTWTHLRALAYALLLYYIFSKLSILPYATFNLWITAFLGACLGGWLFSEKVRRGLGFSFIGLIAIFWFFARNQASLSQLLCIFFGVLLMGSFCFKRLVLVSLLASRLWLFAGVALLFWGILASSSDMMRSLDVADEMRFEGGYDEVQNRGLTLANLQKRARAKLFTDRAPMWLGTWLEIKAPPYFIPSPRGAAAQSVRSTGEVFELDFAVHNAWLNILQAHRLIVGAYLIALFFVLLGRPRKCILAIRGNYVYAIIFATSLACVYMHFPFGGSISSYPGLLFVGWGVILRKSDEFREMGRRYV